MLAVRARQGRYILTYEQVMQEIIENILILLLQKLQIS
jgi:hypothetical protein